jgi:hypothetical protein
LRTIASAALGPAAFQEKETAALGLFFHFFIALIAVSIYYVISCKLMALLDYPLFRSAIRQCSSSGDESHRSSVTHPPKREFSAKAPHQLIIQIFCVGLPIALIMSHFLAISLSYPCSTSQRST